jgi:hypothetical protein
MSSGPSEPVQPRQTNGSDDAIDPEAELLRGTPIRIASWIALPALIVILGVLAGTFLLRGVHSEFGLLRWTQLAAAAMFVIVGVVLAWVGYLAYSRITVADTTRFLKVSVIGVAILCSALVVAGVFGGSTVQVLAGVFVMAGLWGSTTRFPSDPIPFRALRLLIYRVAFVVAAVLLASAVIAGVLALVDRDLPDGLVSTYLGAGINYGVIAIIGGVISTRRLSAASRHDAPRSS